MKTRIASALALLTALCSCGQVGPLYLPEDQAATTTVVPAVPVAGGDAAAQAPDAGAAPATNAGGANADGTDAGRTDGTATVPDKTNEPRRRAH
jgi:predicted small lipoprotein YifL